MMTIISREKAREIVDGIRENNGGISEADRANTPASVLRSLDSVRKKLGRATQTLATNLYTKDTRFVFEIIQNAEDNEYTTEQAILDKPFLIFRLCSKSIIIDSNEDGFTEANVRAICSTGESTKTVSSGYIGEKGIGFKSVFKVASKVHIQSEPFSFFFEHTRGDGGLGMITPIYEDHHKVFPNVRTSMTLTLANPSEAEKLATEFYYLPETLLLFLNKLKRITVLKAEPPYDPSEITYSKQEDPVQHRAILKKLSVYNRNGTRLRKRAISTYQIKSRTLENLPQHHARPHSNQAELVLAFPLDSQSVPIVQQQYFFAFLPIRQVGFSFQIQCDFITQASREDIERTDRNEAILHGVAETFRDAVLDFCAHPTLQFHWMRYLPKTDMIYDAFWKPLLPEIVRLLKETPVLRPWSGGPLKRPDQLKRVPSYCLDEAGNPLFKDLPDEIYLHFGYGLSDFELLHEILAVKELNFWDISLRVRADLDSPYSRWKSSTTSDAWISRSATMLMRSFHTQDTAAEIIGLKALPLIPLQDGSWVSSASRPLFFPNNEGVPVPTDLGLPLVDPQALDNSARKSLFTKLDVQDCVPEKVVNLILEKYNSWCIVSLQYSVSHLRYLYWHLPENRRGLARLVYFRDSLEWVVYRPPYRSAITLGRKLLVEDFIEDDLYFDTDGIYDAKRLSMPVKLGSKICPGFHLRYINQAYIDAVPSHVLRYGTSWEHWLERSGVRRAPRLVKWSTPVTLSKFFDYILKWRNEDLVGILKTHWALYKGIDSLETRPVIDALREAAVPRKDGTDAPLHTTYLPLPKLLKLCTDFDVQVDQGMSFLKLPAEIDDDAERDWSFLKMFDVGHEANTRFYLDVLRCFACTHEDLSENSSKALLRIYEAIEMHSKADDRESISKFFAENNVIYIPARGSQDALWTNSGKCVWKTPDFIAECHSLSNIKGFRGNEKLKRLFNGVLDIKNADWRNFMFQLEAHKDRGLPRNDSQDIYRHLYQEVEGEDWIYVRQCFEENNLVYVPVQNKWYKPSSCLWTADTQISGQVAIREQYAGLEVFFTRCLGVEEPSIDTYIQELKLLVSRNYFPPIRTVKSFIKKIGCWKPQQPALEPLKLLKFLPVRGLNGALDGALTLKCVADVFVIVDRKEHGDAFRGSIPILDFSIEEVHDLTEFILALGLCDKYTSKAVQECSTVDGSHLDQLQSDEMRHKAYAIFRCVVHFGSLEPRKVQDSSLYRKLQQANVYESDWIFKSMTIFQNGKRHTVEGARANVHIDIDEEHFQFYVPKDKRSQKLCYLNQLPKRLAILLGMKDTTAIRMIGNIMAASSDLLDDLLTEEGIIQVSGVEPSHVEASTDGSDYEVAHSSLTTSEVTLVPSGTPRPKTPEPAFTATRLPARASIPRNHRQSPNVKTASSFLATPTHAKPASTPGTFQFTFYPERREQIPEPMVSSNDEYRLLLGRVMDFAKRAEIPDSVDPSDRMRNSDGPPLVMLSSILFGQRSERKQARIDAAGELYAFELLRKQLLIGFDRDNWKSTIRDEVCIHDRYKDMLPWNGKEISDITYEDKYGMMAALLKSKGYPTVSASWPFVRSTFYFEVRTTVQGCDAPLFLNKGQYDRHEVTDLAYEQMKRMALNPEKPPRDIYVILRVFNLGQDSIGLRIYVDPATMEREGKLVFEPETYSVCPPKDF